MQKQPDPMRVEGALRRIFPLEKISRLVYFEQAVLADSSTLVNVDYEIFAVTQDEFFHVNLSKTYKEPPQGIELRKVDLVEVLPDLPLFFEPAVAKYSTHIRVHVSAEVGVEELLDCYTFFEDTQLSYFLTRSWLHAKTRAAFPGLYVSAPTQGSALSCLPNPNAANVIFGEILRKFLSFPAGYATAAAIATSSSADASFASSSEGMQSKLALSGEKPVLRSQTSVGSRANLGAAPFAMSDMSAEAVEARMSTLVGKIRALEELIVCMCSPRGLVFQRLLLSHTDLLARLYDDIAVGSSNVQFYLAARAANEGSLSAGTSAAAASSSMSGQQVMPARRPSLAKEAGGVSSEALLVRQDSLGRLGSARGPPNLLAHQLSVGGGGSGGPGSISRQGSSSSANAMSWSSSSATVTATSTTEFANEKEVFDSREGHPVEELARVEYLVTALTVMNFVLEGSHGLGAKRASMFMSGSTGRLFDLLNIMLLVDSNLLRPSGLATNHIEVARRRRQLEARSAYEAAARDQQRQAVRMDPLASASMEQQFAEDDRFLSEIFFKLQTKLSELDVQWGYFIYLLFDVCEQVQVMRAGALSMESILQHILTSPRFISDRLPSLVRQIAGLLSQKQAPRTGLFAYVLLDAVCRLLFKSSDLRVAVARECALHISSELATKETMEKLRQSPYFYYRQCIPFLKSFVRYVAKDYHAD